MGLPLVRGAILAAAHRGESEGFSRAALHSVSQGSWIAVSSLVFA